MHPDRIQNDHNEVMHMPSTATKANFRLSALPLAIIAATGISVPAAAQEGARTTGLEEVVVTAQRREESLQEAPISITAFTEQKLSDIGVFDVSQVADFAPNVTIQKQPSSNSNMGINIRGIGMGETSLLADPKIGFYMDGVFMSKTVGAVFDVVDLERIEVLRGPQGTLFGRNTTGGAINVTTKKPLGEFAVKAEASMGAYGGQVGGTDIGDISRYGASVDLPAFANIATKFSAYKMDSDGWSENNYDGPPLTPATSVASDLASEDNKAYRIALRWTPLESLTVDYSYDKTDNEGVPAPFQIVEVKDSLYNPFTNSFDPTPYEFIGGALYQQMADTVLDPENRRRRYALDGVTDEWLEVDGHALTVAWELGDVTLKYIFGDRDTDSGYESTDLDGGAFTARDLFYGSFAGNNAPIPAPGFNAAIDKGTIETTSHEFQIIGSAFEEKLFYTGGLFYFEEEVFQDNPQTFSIPIEFVLANPAANTALRPLYNAFGYCPPEFGGFLCTGTQRLPIPATDTGKPGLVDFRYGQDTESWAAYGQFTYAVTDRLDLTLGARYTEDDKDANLFNESIAGAGELKADESWDNFSYVANVSYQLTDDVNFYVKYTTGYNGGGFNARAATVAGFTTPFEEEEVETWEIGMKSEWFDNRVRLNVSAFTNDYTDIQIAQFEAGSGGASSKIVNAGEGTYQGIEIDGVWVPVDGLSIEFTYGYLDTEFDEYLARDPATDQEVDISGITTVAQSPENSASMGVQYDFQPFSFGALSARVDAVYKDEFVFHPYNNQYDSTDDRTLINARLSLNEIPVDIICCDNKSKLRISLWGKNLTDEEYRNWGIDFSSLGFAGDVYGEPLSYGIDFVYTYN